DRLASAAKMHDRRRRDGDLRHGARDRYQELEILDEDAAFRARQPAAHLHGRRAVQTLSRIRVEADRQLGRNHLDVAELQHEVAVPGMAVVLAVGSEPESQVLLQAYDLADRRLLDRTQFLRRQVALLGPLARRDQRVRTDQAADMVGAERRFAAWHAAPS